MSAEIIPEIVDRHLALRISTGGNRLPLSAPEPEMLHPAQDPEEEWKTWLPIASKVTDQELQEFEQMIGYKFPDSFKVFLKHKHFYELIIHEATFTHPVNSWRLQFAKMIFNGYPREFHIDKGYIPFADWSDWGLLCFDTHQEKNNSDYPVILWDHEIWDSYPKVYENFVGMMIDLDKKSEMD